MSRNLGRTDCYFCNGEVQAVEPTRAITRDDTGPHYYPEYASMKVANAACVDCEAKYLAWVDVPGGWGHFQRRHHDDRPFVDLSFRSTFNDEPGNDDLPVWRIERVPQRTPWDKFCSGGCGKRAYYSHPCRDCYDKQRAAVAKLDP